VTQERFKYRCRTQICGHDKTNINLWGENHLAPMA